MPFFFRQASGILSGPDGRKLFTGYSGHGNGRGNPSSQHIRMVGPLPQGRYRIGSEFECCEPIAEGQCCPDCNEVKAHRHGPDVLRLTPLAAPDRPSYTPAQEVIVQQLAAAGHTQAWMFGRGGMLCHGDSVANPGSASEGCIVVDHATRLLIAASTEKELEVTI